MRRYLHSGISAAIICLMPAALFGQSFNPFAGSDSLLFQFNLRSNFFSSPEAEASDRAALRRRIETWSTEFSNRPSTPAQIERFIVTGDSILTVGGKHVAYFSLRASLDVTDQDANRESQALYRELAPVAGRLSEVLGGLPDSTWRNPQLRKWTYLAGQVRRGNPAQPMTPAMTSAVAALTQWQAPTHNALVRETPSQPIETPAGKRDPLVEYTALAANPDRGIRRAAYQSNKNMLLSHRETFAQLVIAAIQGQDAAARLRGAPGFREQSYGGRFLSRSIVQGIFAALASAAAVNKEYETAVRNHLAADWHIDSVHSWDLGLPESGVTAPQFTIADASKIFLSAVAPLGERYVQEAAALLDPANGRLDLFPRPNRQQRPGFSTGNVGYPSVFFQGRYGGYTEDLVILLHEGGHSIQNMLMTRNHVPYLYSSGPSYFTESFAGFNELLLLDYLYRAAPDRRHKIFYLQRFLDQSTEVFKSAREAMLEDALYDSVAAGRIRSADDIERLTQSVGSIFSIWFGPSSDRPMEWENASMAVTRPLYRLNYVVSKLLALNYFAELQRDSSSFLPAYRRLLESGYIERPDVLLREVGGLRITGEGLVPRAVELIRGRMQELSRLYAQGSNN